MMLPTPSTSHVSFDTVYEPAEDSFLLLDTLSSATESAWLKQRFGNPTPNSSLLAVEVGTGSGVVIAFLSAHSEDIIGQPILSLGIDVNLHACHATKKTANLAIAEQSSCSSYVASVCADLGTSLRLGSVDILVFNPPYVPSEDLPTLPHLYQPHDAFDRDSHLLSLSYAGGQDGMETTKRLLEQVPELLSEKGIAYVLLCAQNKPEEVKQQILAWQQGRWQVETIGRSGKVAGWEKLQIVRIWKDH